MDIVYFGNDWSAENRTSSHHIAVHLANLGHRVLYVESPGLRAPKGNRRDLLKLFRKVAKGLRSPKSVRENLSVMTLIQIPLHRYSLVRSINRFVTRAIIRFRCWQTGFDSPLLWFVLPHLPHLMGSLDGTGSVYYCIDDYSALPDIDRNAIAAMDAESTRRADVTIVASQNMFDRKAASATNIFLNPHGVDLQKFRIRSENEQEMPEDIRTIAHPIVGFFGLIEKWVDLDLIHYIATQRPNWNIVFVGRLAVDAPALQGMDNIWFLGHKVWEDIPAYGRAFDVCLLPYVLNDQVLASNPIKLREYLALGKPVVSVRFPEVEKFADIVSIADDKDDFVRSIEYELSNSSNPEYAKRRRESVQDCSWESRTREALTHIQESISHPRKS